MVKCRFCGAPVADFEYVCEDCATKHDKEEQQEFEAQREEDGL